MKTEEDEAFDEIARKQGMWGGGFMAKRAMAANKLQEPIQRKWVALTDEEIDEGNKQSWVNKQAWESAVWWASEKLKERNHGT